MAGVIMTALVGLLICFFGYRNMKGDISSLHSYHRSRVSEEDVKPFGKMVGLGTLICGISVIVYSVFLFVGIKTSVEIYTIVGSALMIVGLIVGMALSFYAMKKYNGGIF